MKFNELPLSEEMKGTLTSLGFEEATPIQSKAIPPALEGRDIIGQAQTGTGKTAGFAIPIIEKIEPNKTLQALILVPTRELALQVADSVTSMAAHKNIRISTVFGGAPIDRQIRELKQGFEIVVGTPGRVIDLMKRKILKMQNISFLVLDEVDEMLSMGFIDDINLVAEKITHPHQTLFFSATMTNKIQAVANNFLQDPIYVKIKPSKQNLKQIEQLYLVMKDSQKQQVLANLLRTQKPEKAIIFARTKRRVDEITDHLVHNGFIVDRIHGDLSQEQRTFTFKKFRNGLTPIVVATDVAARGLDIKELSHVYNFDLPQETEYYVHRIGRTGRADASGIAVSFFTPKEVRTTLPQLEKITNSAMRKISHPSADEVVDSVRQEAIIKLIKNMENDDINAYVGQAKELLQEHDPAVLIASALMLLTPEFDENSFRSNFQEDSHVPYRDRDGRGDRNRQNNRGRNRNRDERGRRGRDGRDQNGRNCDDRNRGGNRSRDERGRRSPDERGQEGRNRNNNRKWDSKDGRKKLTINHVK